MHLDPRCLKDKVILVTGCGSGMGSAVAITAARFGATVILMSRQIKKMTAVYDYIVELGYATPALYPMDFLQATPENLHTCAETLKNEFGHLDGLVHNAAMLGVLCPTEHYPPDLWLKVLQVNVNVPFLLTQQLLPLLKAAKHSSILFTTGQSAHIAKPYWGAFCASKHALLAFAKLLAAELETNTRIRVHTIDPGPFRSQLRATAFPAGNDLALPCPEDLANSYIELLSEYPSIQSGQHLQLQAKATLEMAF